MVWGMSHAFLGLFGFLLSCEPLPVPERGGNFPQVPIGNQEQAVTPSCLKGKYQETQIPKIHASCKGTGLQAERSAYPKVIDKWSRSFFQIKKCLLSAGSIFLRTWAGSTAIRLNAVRLDSWQMFTQGLLYWVSLEVKLLAPLSMQPTEATDEVTQTTVHPPE